MFAKKEMHLPAVGTSPARISRMGNPVRGEQTAPVAIDEKQRNTMMPASSTLEKASTYDSAAPVEKHGADDGQIDILIVDDHALFRQGLAMLLADLFPKANIVEASTSKSALEAAGEHGNFQLVLVDLMLPDADGIETLENLARMLPGAATAIVSASENLKDMTKSYRAGARGYIVKSSSSEVMRHALPLILAGETYIPSNAMAALTREAPAAAPAGTARGAARSTSPGAPSLTPRQHEILIEMARGKQNRDIAETLGMLEGTVKVHVKGILQKLGVNNRTHAVVKGLRAGLVPQEIVAPDDTTED
jgi:DNA-binding NarL/FixJ family response regulator